jgi:hypothetical protein
MRGFEFIVMVAVLLGAVAGCGRLESTTPEDTASTTGIEPADTDAPAPVAGFTAAPVAMADPPAADVRASRVVFLDLEECCDCTRTRTDASWAALSEVLAGRPDLPVERVHMDTEAAEAQAYMDLRPVMVPPGIYVMNGDGGLIEMLQGEVAAESLRALLD